MLTSWVEKVEAMVNISAHTAAPFVRTLLRTSSLRVMAGRIAICGIVYAVTTMP